MTKINFDSFSAVKYKNELYQMRLSSYLSRCEDYEEIDFIKEEIKLFDDCFNAVNFSAYCQNMEDYNYIKDEVGEFAVSGMYPVQNQEVLSYIDDNPNEEKRLEKTFSMIGRFLSEKEKLTQQICDPKPTFEPAFIEGSTNDLHTFFESQSVKVNTFNFENNFDHVPSKIVFNYFKTELVDKNYLSLDDLHKYLFVAFDNKKIPVEKFLLKGKFTIGKIRNIFYRYYTEIAQDKHGLKLEYCRLLGEYFNGFDTDKTMNNFNK